MSPPRPTHCPIAQNKNTLAYIEFPCQLICTSQQLPIPRRIAIASTHDNRGPKFAIGNNILSSHPHYRALSSFRVTSRPPTRLLHICARDTSDTCACARPSAKLMLARVGVCMDYRPMLLCIIRCYSSMRDT